LGRHGAVLVGPELRRVSGVRRRDAGRLLHARRRALRPRRLGRARLELLPEPRIAFARRFRFPIAGEENSSSGVEKRPGTHRRHALHAWDSFANPDAFSSRELRAASVALLPSDSRVTDTGSCSPRAMATPSRPSATTSVAQVATPNRASST